MKQFVRILTAAVAIALTGGTFLQAQSDYSSSKATSYLTIGPSFSGGASIIFSPPEGYKVSPVFAWRGAADMTYPLTPSIAATFGLGLEGRAHKLRNPDNSDFFTSTHINYFTLTPGIRFSSFFVGLNIGLPMSGSYFQKAGTVETTSDMTDAAFDEVATIIEPKLGAVVELMNNKTGWLGLTIMGTVTTSEIYDRPESTVAIDDAGDFHMASLQLGVTYQFAIPGTRK